MEIYGPPAPRHLNHQLKGSSRMRILSASGPGLCDICRPARATGDKTLSLDRHDELQGLQGLGRPVPAMND